MRAAVLFFFVSLLLTVANASSLIDFRRQIESCKSLETYDTALRDAPESIWDDNQLSDVLEESHDKTDWRRHRSELSQLIAGKIALDRKESKGLLTNPKEKARQILATSVSRDPGREESRNWLAKSLERIAELIRSWFKPPKQSNSLPRLNPGVSMAFLEPVIWSVLALGLGGALLYVLLKFRIVRRQRSQGQLLDEEEELLSSDEWLIKAKGLESNAEFREAVRCLYIASLVRLDEAGILKFVRSETNWEHLTRFEADKDKLPDLDLKTITRDFDRVWYGFRVEGSEDVARFRMFYESVLRNIHSRAQHA